MKPISILVSLLALVAALTVGSMALTASEPRPISEAERALSPVRALVLARPFTLERPAQHVWRAEAPTYDAGFLVVLEVDPSFVEPRQTEEPVLQAGAETVERVNHGERSGRVVGIVPCARDAAGRPGMNLSTTAFFFGPEGLPERVTMEDARRALQRAVLSGARPFSGDEIARALERGGALMALRSRDELDPVAGVLVLEHSPEERDLGTGLMAPR